MRRKGYSGLDQIIKTKKDWDKAKHFTKTPDSSLWSEVVNMEVGKDRDGKPILHDKVVVTNEPLHDAKLKEWDSTHKY